MRMEDEIFVLQIFAGEIYEWASNFFSPAISLKSVNFFFFFFFSFTPVLWS